AALRGAPHSLVETRAAQKRIPEYRDLARVRRAVRVDHGYDVTGRSFESAGKRVPLSSPSLLHYPDVGPQPAGYRYCVVHPPPVHHASLVTVPAHPFENMPHTSF